MKYFLSSFLVLLSLNAMAQNKSPEVPPRLSQEVKNLGGNENLLKLSKEISPDKKIRVVQKRLVPRENRIELGLRYGQKFGGDSYLQTQSYQFNFEYHINPRWSAGLIYSDYGSQLSPEGSRVFKEAISAFNAGGGLSSFPNIDAPQNSLLAQVQFYPIYGKINFLDKNIIQFDMSLILGGGQITLASGNSSLLSTGLGFGIWISNRVSTRLEVRYESYQDKDVIYDTKRDLNTVGGFLGVGILL